MFFFFGGGEILKLNKSVKNKKVSEKILENYQYKSAPNLVKLAGWNFQTIVNQKVNHYRENF